MRLQKVVDSMGYTIKEGNYEKFGVQMRHGAFVFTFEGEKEDDCCILLYDRKHELLERLKVPAEYCMGSVRSVSVSGLPAKRLMYNYEINGSIMTDAYARRIIGREKWNDQGRAAHDYAVYGGYEPEEFDWQGDRPPEVPRHAMFLYRLHVRGFSMDAGIRGKTRGTFQAVREAIPRLKKLGVTTLELMPVYEFEEVVPPEPLPPYLKWESREEDLIKPGEVNGKGQVNFWGYVPGNYFAVKASYSSTPDASREFKELIRALHAEGMECVMEMYFEEGMNQNVILDALRFWVREYHIDGFHLLGNRLPVTAAAQDLRLRRTKLFYTGFDSVLMGAQTRYPHLFQYCDEYVRPVRMLLNDLGGSLGEFVCQQRKQHPVQGFVNYVASTNGFTLLDAFSYDSKHNEDNGEDNRDGSDWNYSSNCGAEGRTRKRSINELREHRMRNALAALLLAQGVPLLLAGDEAGNSQEGNNNAYCQDNPIGWVNWQKADKYGWLVRFIGQLAEFRREHPVIAREEPMELNDHQRKGFPDLSYHGENAWVSTFPRERTAVGMLYCGAYALREDGTEDDFVYIGYNFHSGLGRLALPKLPEKKQWYLVMDTSRGRDAFLPEEQKIEVSQFSMKGQSVIILLGK